MRRVKTAKKSAAFSVLLTSETSQSAVMVLQHGESTGEPKNEHSNSEQWLYVVSGSAAAAVNGRRVKIRERSLVLIERGEKHQITNTGRLPLVTLNFYVPPAYDEAGEPIEQSRSKSHSGKKPSRKKGKGRADGK
jgi:mannose-6-phosphate isomerase-like protein (cupin superfamily)